LRISGDLSIRVPNVHGGCICTLSIDPLAGAALPAHSAFHYPITVHQKSESDNLRSRDHTRLLARKGPVSALNVRKQTRRANPRLRLRFAGVYLGVAIATSARSASFNRLRIRKGFGQFRVDEHDIGATPVLFCVLAPDAARKVVFGSHLRGTPLRRRFLHSYVFHVWSPTGR
jgi:hypothetical protein